MDDGQSSLTLSSKISQEKSWTCHLYVTRQWFSTKYDLQWNKYKTKKFYNFKLNSNTNKQNTDNNHHNKSIDKNTLRKNIYQFRI